MNLKSSTLLLTLMSFSCNTRDNMLEQILRKMLDSNTLSIDTLTEILGARDADVKLIKKNKYYTFYECNFTQNGMDINITFRHPNNSKYLTLITLNFPDPKAFSEAEFVNGLGVDLIDLRVIPEIGLLQRSYEINGKDLTFGTLEDDNRLIKLTIKFK